MTFVKVKGFKIYIDNRGKLRCYHRKSGLPINLQKHPIGSIGFFAECTKVQAKKEVTPISERKGTLGSVIVEYKQSHKFNGLAERTAKDYRTVLDYFQPIYDIPLSEFQKPGIIKIRDKAYEKKGRWFANYVSKLLSIIFNFAIERGYVDKNPVLGIKQIPKPKNSPDANRPWSAEERKYVLERAPWKIKVPLAICMETGVRIGDVLILKKNQFDGEVISLRTGKTGQTVYWPVTSLLKSILEEAPEHHGETIAANSKGKPWTYGGFRTEWVKLRGALEKEGIVEKNLTIHGLRHTMAHRLREMGTDLDIIADALGHASTTMTRHYAKNADLRRTMALVRENLEAGDKEKSV